MQLSCYRNRDKKQKLSERKENKKRRLCRIHHTLGFPDFFRSLFIRGRIWLFCALLCHSIPQFRVGLFNQECFPLAFAQSSTVCEIAVISGEPVASWAVHALLLKSLTESVERDKGQWLGEPHLQHHTTASRLSWYFFKQNACQAKNHHTLNIVTACPRPLSQVAGARLCPGYHLNGGHSLIRRQQMHSVAYSYVRSPR